MLSHARVAHATQGSADLAGAVVGRTCLAWEDGAQVVARCTLRSTAALFGPYGGLAGFRCEKRAWIFQLNDARKYTSGSLARGRR